MRLTKILHVGLRFLEPMDDMNRRVLNNALSLLCFYGLFFPTEFIFPMGRTSSPLPIPLIFPLRVLIPYWLHSQRGNQLYC